MNDRRPKGPNDDRREEVPPFSRVFVVCWKQHTEEDLRQPFEQFGKIENLYMPKDRFTGDSKGVAYIKYAKTSSAAAAIEKLNKKSIGKSNKPIKVMVANQRNEDDNDANESKYTRLFILVPKNETEPEIKEHFSTFGEVLSLYLQKNKGKFAYVSYGSFLDAAQAYEQCDRKYKAVFAVPKEELKRNRENYESKLSVSNSHGNMFGNDNQFHNDGMHNSRYGGSGNDQNDGYKRITVTVSPQLPERYIGSLFNVIPGMESVEYSVDTYARTSKAIITYGEHKYAACAVDRLNNFEFPSGEVVSVQPDTDIIARAATDLTHMVQSLKNAMDTGSSTNELVHLADAIAQASSLIKVATTSIAETPSQDTGFCNVKLPPIQLLADSQAPVAKRCFIVCKPVPPPVPVLRDVFCRFGNFIDVIVYSNKSYGFVKFASAKSADDAIKTLNGAVVFGVRMKVLEADEKQPRDESNIDRKRMKMDVDLTESNL